MYLVDTDVLSMMRRPRSPGGTAEVSARLLSQGFAISAATILEIEQGARWAGRRDPEREAEIRRWLDRVLASFDITVLPVGVQEARLWALMRATPALRGFVEGSQTGPDRPPRSEGDLIIAATAIITGRIIVTRNHRHMERIGCWFRLPGIVGPLEISEDRDPRAQLELIFR